MRDHPVLSHVLLWSGLVSPAFAQSPSGASPASTASELGTAYDAGVWRAWAGDAPVAMSARYQAAFHSGGMEFTPVLGDRVEHNMPLRLTLTAITRGGEAIAGAAEPTARPQVVDDEVVEYARDHGVVERYAAREDGVEVLWVFPVRPAGAGDLVVRMGLETELVYGGAMADGGIRLDLAADGGAPGVVTIGGVTGIGASGRRVRGSSRVVGARYVEFVLPGDFVDSAQYPLVLDPLIGAPFPLHRFAEDARSPDVAFDEASNHYCVVWEWPLSGSDQRIMARRIDVTNGAWLPPTVISAPGEVARKPVIANVRATGCFVIAFEQTWEPLPFTRWTGVYARRYFAADGSLGGTLLQVAPIGFDPDIGGDASGSDDEAIVIWEVPNGWPSPGLFAADLRTGRTIRVWNSIQITSSTRFRNSAISRTMFEPYHVVLWEEWTPVCGGGPGNCVQLMTQVVHRSVGLHGVPTRIRQYNRGGVTQELQADVDGDGCEWGIVWRSHRESDNLQYARYVFDPTQNGLRRLPFTNPFDITASSGVRFPRLARVGDRDLLVYQVQVTGTTYGLRCSELIASLRVSCELEVPVPSGSLVTHAVVGHRSGGAPVDDKEGFVVFSIDRGSRHGIYGQRWSSFPPVTDLGGECGTGGRLDVRPSAVNTISLEYSGHDPAATAGFLGISLPGANLFSCGSCSIAFPLVTRPETLRQGNRGVISLIVGCPAISGLIQTQLLVLDTSSRPCGQLPGLAASNRLLIDIDG